MTSLFVFPSKTTTEIVPYQMDLVGQIPQDATLTSAAAAMTVFSGTDATPNAMVVSCSFDGTTATAKITGGVAGVIYLLAITAGVLDGAATYSVVGQGYIAVLP